MTHVKSILIFVQSLRKKIRTRIRFHKNSPICNFLTIEKRLTKDPGHLFFQTRNNDHEVWEIQDLGVVYDNNY